MWEAIAFGFMLAPIGFFWCCCDPCPQLCDSGVVEQFQLTVPAAMFDADASDSGDEDVWCNDTECDEFTGSFLVDKVDVSELKSPEGEAICLYQSEEFDACTGYFYDEFGLQGPPDTWIKLTATYIWEYMVNSSNAFVVYLYNVGTGGYIKFNVSSTDDIPRDCEEDQTFTNTVGTNSPGTNCAFDDTEVVTVGLPP